MNKSKFGKFVALGALVGGVISLFDRGTRAVMKERAERVGYYAKNPGELKETVEAEVNKWTNLYETVTEQVSYYTSQVDELKDLTPAVKELVNETKEAFSEDEQ
ncbi:YtxH domain-containing protein [Planococcaceae bacterium Storch 2/2-2]|nr:YtxH domain-containing protein [Planococcaceae bacterium Storch 2/2-2]